MIRQGTLGFTQSGILTSRATTSAWVARWLPRTRGWRGGSRVVVIGLQVQDAGTLGHASHAKVRHAAGRPLPAEACSGRNYPIHLRGRPVAAPAEQSTACKDPVRRIDSGPPFLQRKAVGGLPSGCPLHTGNRAPTISSGSSRHRRLATHTRRNKCSGSTSGAPTQLCMVAYSLSAGVYNHNSPDSGKS